MFLRSKDPEYFTQEDMIYLLEEGNYRKSDIDFVNINDSVRLLCGYVYFFGNNGYNDSFCVSPAGDIYYTPDNDTFRKLSVSLLNVDIHWGAGKPGEIKFIEDEVLS